MEKDNRDNRDNKDNYLADIDLETIDEDVPSDDATEIVEVRTVDANAEKEVKIDPNDAVDVVGVSFRDSGKIYHFASCGKKVREGTKAIVETARGIEYGTVTMSNRLIPKNELVLPLKKLLRTATDDDDAKYAENRKKEDEAFAICKSKIAERGLDMKLIDVEYTFDNAKLLFYFTSDERVDFRDLVKDLAAVFHTRIELRQIGIRDETKIMGGLGVCYREYCCHSFLGDFAQVSIKMAKEQGLSLSSAKISGACGRLMCCLRFEHETYQEEIARTPKVGAVIVTPDGTGTVIESKPLLGLVKVCLDADPEGTPKIYDRDVVRAKTDEDETTKRGEKVERVARPVNVPFVRNRYNVLTAESEQADAAQKSGEKAERSERSDKSEKSEKSEKGAQKKRSGRRNQQKRADSKSDGRADKAERSEKTEKIEKIERIEKQSKPTKQQQNSDTHAKAPGKDRRTKQSSDKNRSRIPTAEKVSDKIDKIEKIEKIEKQDLHDEIVKNESVKGEKSGKKKNDRRYHKRPSGTAQKVSEKSDSDKK